MVISRPSSTGSEHEDMEVEEESEVARYMPQHKWLLAELPTLPVFSDVRVQLSVALRQVSCFCYIFSCPLHALCC